MLRMVPLPVPGRIAMTSATPIDLAQDFLFLCTRGFVDVGDHRIGQLLHFGLGALALVLADFLLVLVLLQRVHAVAADVADGDARLFGILAGELGQFLAAFLRHVGDRQAPHLAVADRVEPEPRRADPLVDRSEEHTSELQSLMRISYAVFCLKKKNQTAIKYTY